MSLATLNLHSSSGSSHPLLPRFSSSSMDLQSILFSIFLGVMMKLCFKMLHKYKITKRVR